MPSLTEQIFYRVHICRTFRVGDLLHILKRHPTNPPIEDFCKLQAEIGNLYKEKFIDIVRDPSINFVYTIIQEKIDDKLINSFSKPDLCELHDAWYDRYRVNYEANYEIIDLTSLLYHEAFYTKKCLGKEENLLNFVEEKAQKYLWDFCHSIAFKIAKEYPSISLSSSFSDIRQAFIVLDNFFKEDSPNCNPNMHEKIVDYIQNFKEHIEILKKFEEIFSPLEYQQFCIFLDSLNPFNRR